MSKMSQSTHIKPRLCLTVGVTGHRLHRLEGVDLSALRATVDATLAELSKAMTAEQEKHKSLFDHATPQLRMISAVADGADTIVAQAALAAGWRVDACLPFAREVYANDFEASRTHNEFVALLGRMTAVFELNGEHVEPTKRDGAYEAVGRLLLEQCDVLLAVWDGDPGRGRGGTARVVAEAVARHIPVIHIHAGEYSSTNATAPTAATECLWTGFSDAEIEQPSVEIVPRLPAEKGIRVVVHALTAPPDNNIDRRMLAHFYRAEARRSTSALPYPMLLALAGVRKISRTDLRAPQAADSTAALTQFVASALHTDSAPDAQHAEPVPHSPDAQHAPRAPASHFASALAKRFGIADAAATYYAQIFRSGFVANFGLAALAVVLALGGLLAPAFKLPIICAELVCIALILTNTKAGTRFGWHERWMDNRHLAEQLRAISFTSLLGDLTLRAHTAQATHDAASIPGWVGWLARATAREIALPHAVANVAYLSRVSAAALALIDDQAAYQRSNATRMHKLEHRLHHAGEFLFGATIFACAVWIIAKLTGLPMGSIGKVGLTEVVTFSTAVLPALGAALYGIRMQGDFAGIAHRSQTTVARLERLKHAMLNDPIEYARLNARLRALADIMLTDVANWRTTYQARPLALPG